MKIDPRLRGAARFADGKILVSGTFTNLAGQLLFAVLRLNPDGRQDNTFLEWTNGVARALSVQGDGKVVIAGAFRTSDGLLRESIARLNTDGGPDPSLSPVIVGAEGGALVYSVLVQADGKILVGGSFVTLGGRRINVARLNPDGSVDAAFTPVVSSSVYTMALQTDGKILLRGSFSTVGGFARFGLARLNPDGRLDSAFDAGAIDDYVFSLAVQADGKVLVGGAFNTLAGQPRRHVGRLTATSGASQALSIDAMGSVVAWTRAGAGPELEQVIFEQSTDGASFTPLGSGIRASNGWRLNGLALPVGMNCYLRARGRAASGEFSGSSFLIEWVTQFYRPPPLSLFGLTMLGNGEFQFRFTNTSAVDVTVLATTNIASATPSWTVLGSPSPIGGALYQFTDTTAANFPQRFYQLRSP